MTSIRELNAFSGLYCRIELSVFHSDIFFVHFSEVKAYVEKIRKYLPTREDVEGAARAVVRLQQTYNLDAASMINLHKRHATDNEGITLDEVYHIGRTAFSWGKMAITRQWMLLALEKYTNGTQESGIRSYYPPHGIDYKIDIRDHLAYANFKVRFSMSILFIYWFYFDF